MATKKENEIERVRPATTTIHEDVPDFLKPQLGKQVGLEDVEQSDLLLPRLGLCQSLSPQRRKSDSAYIPGLEEGQLFNTVTKEIYGESLDVIPLFFFKNRIKYFPIEEGGGIDCISTDGVSGGRISPDSCQLCRFSHWGNGASDDAHGNDSPDCTLYHNFMGWLPDQFTPIAISYKATGLKVSKQLLASMRITRLPMYAKKYKITVSEMKSGSNVWFEKIFTTSGFVDKGLYEEMEKAFKSLKEANVVLDTTGEAEKYGDASFDGKTEL